MSAIRLPIENFYVPPHPLKQPYAELTPDHIAQILGDLPERLAAVESYMQRIKAMEAAAMQPQQDAKPGPCGGDPWPEPLPPPKDDAERIASKPKKAKGDRDAKAFDRVKKRLVQAALDHVDYCTKNVKGASAWHITQVVASYRAIARRLGGGK